MVGQTTGTNEICQKLGMISPIFIDRIVKKIYTSEVLKTLYKGNLFMKKIAIASLLALAAISASAVEVGVTAARDYAGADRDAYGVTVGQSYGKVGVTAGFDRATKGANNQDRFTLIGSYDVTTLGSATVAVKAGGAYLNNQTGADGYALVVGAGVSVPIASKVSLGIDLTRQYGQERVNAYDGNRLTAGVKYAF